MLTSRRCVGVELGRGGGVAARSAPGGSLPAPGDDETSGVGTNGPQTSEFGSESGEWIRGGGTEGLGRVFVIYTSEHPHTQGGGLLHVWDAGRGDQAVLREVARVVDRELSMARWRGASGAEQQIGT